MTALSALVNRRIYALLLACGLATLLAACFVLPGKFTSSIDIRKDGHFSYAYQGEIFLMAFSELSDANKPDEFKPAECYKEDTGETRGCSKDELAEQRKTWDDDAESRAAKRKRDAEEMRMFLGGIDPTDPKAADVFAEKLQRQAGWKRVTNKGHGLFDVDLALTGTLTHDFAFPTFEQMPHSSPFIQLSMRNDGTVRMDAPMFSSDNSNPMRALMGKEIGESGTDIPGAPKTSGTFTLTTDGSVLSNNTDLGPQKATNGQSLTWNVGSQGKDSAPMALLQLNK